jgi:uncharacterized protein YoxC
MASDVTRGEHQQLVARVDVLEREVDGEKVVTRHILEQTRRNGDDLAAIKTRLDRVEGKVDSVQLQIRDLARSLPKIVGDAVRDASQKPRKR